MATDLERGLLGVYLKSHYPEASSADVSSTVDRVAEAYQSRGDMVPPSPQQQACYQAAAAIRDAAIAATGGNPIAIAAAWAAYGAACYACDHGLVHDSSGRPS